MWLTIIVATLLDKAPDGDGDHRSRTKLKIKQEAQLMLTNPHDALRGQSRSPNIVPFHMLGIFQLVQ